MNVKAAIGVTLGFTAAGVGISQLTGPRMDAIRERNKPAQEWATVANDRFREASEDGVSPEEMAEVAAYIRDNDMPDGVEIEVNSSWINFSAPFAGDDNSKMTNLALGPVTAIVGGGFMVLGGGVHALLGGGTTGVPGSVGAGVALAGAGLLGGYIASEVLRD